MPLKELRISGPDKGIIRDVPPNIISDTALITATNCRFLKGQVKSILLPSVYITLPSIILPSITIAAPKFVGCLQEVENEQFAITTGGNIILRNIDGYTGLENWYDMTGTVYVDQSQPGSYITVGGVIYTLSPRGYIDYEFWGNSMYLCCGERLIKITGGPVYNPNTHSTSIPNAQWVTGYPNNLDTPSRLRSPIICRQFHNILWVAASSIFSTQYADYLVWCDEGDDSNWSLLTEAQSGEFYFGEIVGSHILAMEQLQDNLIIYCKDRILKLSYVGSPQVFTLQEISHGMGILDTGHFYRNLQFAGTSTANVLTGYPICNAGLKHYFISNNENRDIIEYDGYNFKSIGKPIIDDMYSDLENATKMGSGTVPYSSLIMVVQDSENSEIVFVYGSVAEVDAGSPSVPVAEVNAYKYNTITGGWSYVHFADQSIYSFRYATPKPFLVTDKIKLCQNTLNIEILDNDNTAGSSNVPMTLVSKLFDCGKPDIYKRLQRIELACGLTNELYDLKVYVGVTNNLNQPVTWSSAYTFDLGVANTYPYIDCEHDARYFQLKFVTPLTLTSAPYLADLIEYTLFYNERGMV